jgi:uncharacterized protein (TIRG00374 family)
MTKKRLLSGSMLKHLLSLAIGLTLIGLLIAFGGSDNLKQLDTVHLAPLAVAFILTLGINTAIAGRWGIFANNLAGRRVAGWLDYAHYFLISRALGFILPKDVTDLGSRALSLNQIHHMSLTRASASVLLDRVADILIAGMFTLAVLPFWLNWWSPQTTLLVMVGVALCSVITLLLAQHWLSRHMVWMYNNSLLLIHRLPLLRKRSPMLLETTSLSGQTIFHAYLFSLLKFSCTAGRMVYFALALGLSIPASLLILGTPLGQVSYLFSFTPGGLGIFEAGWFAILTFGEVAPAEIATFVVGQRVLTLAIILFLALCSQIVYTLRTHHLPAN